MRKSGMYADVKTTCAERPRENGMCNERETRKRAVVHAYLKAYTKAPLTSYMVVL